MSTNGFFSINQWSKQPPPLQLQAACGLCSIYKTCNTPFMPMSGKGKRKVLIVAEAPGQQEDRDGIQLIGNAGQKLLEILSGIGVDMRNDCWLTNALICRPTKGGHNREPTTEEIGYCRPNLYKTIKQLQPDVIIPLGKVAIRSLIALAWKDHEVDDAGTWVGWQAPSIKLNAWICPTYHPSYLLRDDNAALQVAIMQTARHLQRAFSLKGKPYEILPDYASKVVVEMADDKAAVLVQKLMQKNVPLAFDFETTTLKPDGPHAEILCCSVSDGETSVAFPWYGRAIEAVKQLVVSNTPKIAANLRFEERWCRAKLGVSVRNWHWCTVVGAHWRDCRRGIASLKFQSFVRLGIEDYDSHLDSYMKSADDSGNGPNRLKEVEPAVLMKYCGLDSLYEVLVTQKQKGSALS